MSGTSAICQHRSEHYQTPGDSSPRGEKYLDDRTNLGGVYDGESLVAMLYDEREVERYREKTTFNVVLTPAGECRVDGRCRHQEVDA